MKFQPGIPYNHRAMVRASIVLEKLKRRYLRKLERENNVCFFLFVFLYATRGLDSIHIPIKFH